MIHLYSLHPTQLVSNSFSGLRPQPSLALSFLVFPFPVLITLRLSLNILEASSYWSSHSRFSSPSGFPSTSCIHLLLSLFPGPHHSRVFLNILQPYLSWSSTYQSSSFSGFSQYPVTISFLALTLPGLNHFHVCLNILQPSPSGSFPY